MNVKVIENHGLRVEICDTSKNQSFLQGVNFNKLARLVKVFNKFIYSSFLDKNISFDRKITHQVLFSITLCGNYKIRTLNRDYRKKNKITDVLSFPIFENIEKDELTALLPFIELGDIFICKNVAQKQAVEFKISYEQEFFQLITHGFLHLIGYDHEQDEKEAKKMFSLEEKIIKYFYEKELK